MNLIENKQHVTGFAHNRARRGVAVIYAIIMMTALLGVCSLAVDYGHVQMVKSEMQRCADATARGYMTYYNLNGQAYANSHVAQLYASTNNPVDANSGISPTVTVTFGSWNSVSSSFSASVGTIPAVKVKVTRTAANSNGVSLIWGKFVGASSIDLHASAIAALMGGNTANVNVPATSNLYFSGEPSGTTNIWGDNFTNNAPYQVASIPVVPGTYMTFTGLGGTSSVLPGYVSYTGPAGNAGIVVNHGENWDHSFNNPGAENGIADAQMPEDAMVGLFLTSNQPDSTTAPTGQVDWTSAAMANQTTYSNIVAKQPFMIGNGQTSGGVTKQFLVPPGATRLFVSIWDGVDYSNNGGNVTGTVTLKNYVVLVQ